MGGRCLQAYVVRMTGLLQLSDGQEDSQAGKQVEVSLESNCRYAM